MPTVARVVSVVVRLRTLGAGEEKREEGAVVVVGARVEGAVAKVKESDGPS